MPPAAQRAGLAGFEPLIPRDGFEFEPNDTPATATPITVGSEGRQISAGLGYDPVKLLDSSDYYTFTLAQRSGVFLDVDSLLGPFDTQLNLFASDGVTQIASNDTGDDFYNVLTRGVEPALYVDLNPGTYFVQVRSASSSPGYRYALKVLADTGFSASVPALQSLPGAADTLYLDFDGHSATDAWDAYAVGAYDFSGNAAEITPGEREAMTNVWRVVADDFAPFNINISTAAPPPSFADGVAYRVVVGNGDGSAIGQPGAQGAAFFNAYSTGGAADNVGFTFAGNFATAIGTAGTSGEIGHKAAELGNTASQQFGRALGLRYYGGTNPQTEGIMHNPDAGLGVERWRTGNTSSTEPPVVAQDDMAVIASAANTFGYRADDHANTRTAAATVLSSATGFATAYGVVSQVGDIDVFRFTSAGGDTTFGVQPHLGDGYLQNAGNLDAELHVYDSSGTEISGGVNLPNDPSDSNSAFLYVTPLAAGTYYVEVRSDAGAGEVGQYRVGVKTRSPTPTGLDLLPTSDTGSSNTDNRTLRDNSSPAKALEFSVPGTTAGGTVEIYAEGVRIGSAVASGTTTTVVTDGLTDLPDGRREFSIRHIVPGKFTSQDPLTGFPVILDTVIPTADIVDVSPDPRVGGISSITITFSRMVTGVDRADFSLTRNGGPNLLTSSQTVNPQFPSQTFTLDNLATLTQVPGTYTLTLTAAGSNIADYVNSPSGSAGNLLAVGASDTWTVTNVAPQILSFGDSPDPVTPGSNLVLFANSVTDGNNDPLDVRFYRESNGVAGLQASGGDPDLQVGSDSTSFYDITIPAPAVGVYTYYAQATDPLGLLSNVISTTNTVSDTRPAWLAAGSAATWNATTRTLTLTGPATIVADPGAALAPFVNASGVAAKLTINPTSALKVHVASLNLTSGATAKLTSLGAARTATNHRVLVVLGEANIDSASTLDLTDNDLIVDHTGATPVADVEAHVAAGYNTVGDWLGKGITSSVAALDGNFTLAVADNAALAAPFGSAQGGPFFAGVDVDLTTVLVKFTHRADINLDGLVTPDDSAVFGGNYDENQFARWSTGDMNFDGLFTADDSAIFGGFYDESLLQL